MYWAFDGCQVCTGLLMGVRYILGFDRCQVCTRFFMGTRYVLGFDRVPSMFWALIGSNFVPVWIESGHQNCLNFELCWASDLPYFRMTWVSNLPSFELIWDIRIALVWIDLGIKLGPVLNLIWALDL